MIGRRLVRDSEQQTAFDHLIIGWAGCFSRIGLADGDVGEAVETLAFLVAVKGGAGGGLQKLIVRDAAVVIGDAGVEEFAAGAGHLLG